MLFGIMTAVTRHQSETPGTKAHEPWTHVLVLVMAAVIAFALSALLFYLLENIL